MAIEFLYLSLATAPALAIFQESPEKSAKHGTILFYHGFGESKEGYRAVLQRLAEAGFLAIGIDGVGHGMRRLPDFEQRFPPHSAELEGNKQIEADFLSIVRATAQEVPPIIDTLLAKQWAIPGHIGIAGHSFGGFVVYASVVAERRINAAVSVVGSPQWKLLRSDSPHLHLDQFFPVALLSQSAEQDTHVSANFAHSFHEELAQYYSQRPERLRYISYPDSSHDLNPEDWQRAWEIACEWFQAFLP